MPTAIPESASLTKAPIVYVEQQTTYHPLSKRLYELLVEIANLHAKKQADYGRANDPFANVRGSADWGVRPWVGAMVRANDKIKRLQKFAAEGCLANEAVEDSFKDLAVYALIGLVLYEEETACPTENPSDGKSLLARAMNDLCYVNNQGEGS